MDLLIYTGYAWRLMKDDKKEIMVPERLLAEWPVYPEAGDIVEVKKNDI